MWYFVVFATLFCNWDLIESYKAAVVEYNPILADTPTKTVSKNLDEYRLHVQNAKRQKADIIVFPEYGLTTMVADPVDYSIEIKCDNYLVKNLSNLAKENQVYLVINLLEKAETSKNTTEHYNTNLVFDRNGSLIAEYRKINLFGEPNLSAGSQNQNVTFQTDFGVTFGIFTCFDILFRNPSRTILQNNNIGDVVYATSWFSTLPFYASLTVQHGYAASTGVNLLASNIDEPQNTHGGSGIYLANGQSEIYINDVPKSKVIVREVPKVKRRQNKENCLTIGGAQRSRESTKSNMSNYATLRDFRAEDYNFKKIDLSQENVNTSICYGLFCCNFEINVDRTKSRSSDIYKLMAFDGIVPFDVSTAHIRVCSLLACENDSNDSCGKRVKTTTNFKKISVSGILETDATTFYTPLSLNYYLRPLTDSVYCEKNNANSTSVQLTTNRSYRNVVVFGLFGRTEIGN